MLCVDLRIPQWQPEPERGTHPRLALGAYLSTMGLNDGPDDCEPKTTTPAVPLVEPLEEERR